MFGLTNLFLKNASPKNLLRSGAWSPVYKLFFFSSIFFSPSTNYPERILSLFTSFITNSGYYYKICGELFLSSRPTIFFSNY
jgi:hypothetical protein